MQEKTSVAPKPHHLILWVGQVTPEQLDAYIAESYPLGVGGPRSVFAADISYWYDRDYLEAYSQAEPARLDELLLARGVADTSLIAEATRRCGDHKTFTGFILLWNFTSTNADDSCIMKGKLKCVGSWAQQYPYE